MTDEPYVLELDEEEMLILLGVVNLGFVHADPALQDLDDTYIATAREYIMREADPRTSLIMKIEELRVRLEAEICRSSTSRS